MKASRGRVTSTSTCSSISICPERPATYTVFVTLDEYRSNVVTVKVSRRILIQRQIDLNSAALDPVDALGAERIRSPSTATVPSARSSILAFPHCRTTS